MPAKKLPNKTEIYQLKITLKGVKPPIWRRVEVPANMKLSDLNYLILNVMGWGGGHLTSFRFGWEEYVNDTAFMFEELDLEGLPMSKTRLDKVLVVEKQKGLFTYDFGDDWRFNILIEAMEERITRSIKLLESEGRPPKQYGDWS